MVCHVCANTQSHYSVVVQAKFPLSKVRVITSGSGPPVFLSSCHSAFHVMSTRYCLISAGCVSCTHGFAESRQGLARHPNITHPLREETKLRGLLHVVLLQALPSLRCVTEIATAIRQRCVEVAAYWSDHGRFVLIISSFHLPLPFHTSGQANWKQLGPCPSPTLPQKPCWGPSGIGALAASPAIAMCCLSPRPGVAVSWRQVHVLRHLCRFGARMHLALLLCSLKISNGRAVVFLDAFLCVERCFFSTQACPFQLKASHLPLICWL